jgi:uncharacterized protein YceH (UPF0502 family)
MAQDFEQLFKSVFGEQVDKVTAKLQEIARDGVKDELSKLQQEVSELRSRLARLEEERVEKAADRV